VRVIKSRRMEWVGHVTRIGERRVYIFLVRKPGGKRPLGRTRRRWEVILRWIFRKWDMEIWTGSSWFWIGTGGGHL